MVVTREGFLQVVGNAFAGLGFPAEGPSVYEFPLGLFNLGSDLTPINENIDKIVYGLTKWQPKVTTKGVFTPPKVTVTGKDYQEAVANMGNLFLRNLWSDGLAIWPATEERVSWILTGTDLSPDTEVSPPGGFVPRGGIATVKSIAVALAMAGGRPEYMPVLIAIVKAVTEPMFGLQGSTTTTSSVYPAIIVNGPIAKQIRLSSGYGCLGPNPERPAGGAIGRALRILQQDLGGAVPGVGTMSCYGGMRYTNAVFAEDEEGLPKGWNSLAVERGFKNEQNVATAMPAVSAVNISGMSGFGKKETNDEKLAIIAQVMAYPNSNRSSGELSEATWESPDLFEGVVLIARGMADSLASISGYSKLDVKTILWKESSAGAKTPVRGSTGYLTARVEQMTVVVAGGEAATHCYWLPAGLSNHRKLSAEIKLPVKAKWDALLKQAETDLGPIPIWL